MSALAIACQVAALAVMPTLVVFAINRTKAIWSGRRGQPLLQLAYDVLRLLRKAPVYSEVTSLVFRLSPYVVLTTALLSGLVVPVLGVPAALGFPFDFVAFAYVWGLGRLAQMLGALDTGSSFEGMGASREATFSALVEPAFILVAGTACLVTGERSFASLLALRPTDGVLAVVWLASLVTLAVVVQVESARMPVDDPTTHLELTMVHEVMILDHSGPDLAALHVGSAVKLTVGLSMIAALLNPFAGSALPALAGVANLGITLVLAVAIGTIESLIARFKLRAVPQYIVVALVAAGIALLATTFRADGAG
jgi:formate hydrogenlyase subunit 4